MYGADGTPIKILDTTDIDLRVGDYNMNGKFQILKSLINPIVLGIDFLGTYEAKIDFSRKCVIFNNLVAAEICNNSKASGETVKSLIIPLLSEALIRTKISDHYRWQTSIIEPAVNLSNKRIALARCIVSPKSSTVTCRVLNPTLAAVFLKKRTKIGTIEPIDIVNMNTQENCINIIESRTGVSKDTKMKKTQFRSPEEILSKLDIKIDGNAHSEEDYRKLVNFLAKNHDIFARSLVEFPGTNLVMHKIDTGDAPPFRQRMYRATPEAKKGIARQTAEMLKMGIIEETDSEYLSPVILVSKKNGEKRFCVDFRKLNQQTKSVFFPLLTMEDVLDTLAEKKDWNFLIA